MYIDPVRVLQHSQYSVITDERTLTSSHIMKLTLLSNMVINEELNTICDTDSIKAKLASNISSKIEDSLVTGLDMYGRDKNELIRDMSYDEVADMVRLYAALKAATQVTVSDVEYLKSVSIS